MIMLPASGALSGIDRDRKPQKLRKMLLEMSPHLDWEILMQKGLPDPAVRKGRFETLMNGKDPDGRETAEIAASMQPTFGLSLGMLFFFEEVLGGNSGGCCADSRKRFFDWCEGLALAPGEREEAEIAVGACLRFFKRHFGGHCEEMPTT